MNWCGCLTQCNIYLCWFILFSYKTIVRSWGFDVNILYNIYKTHERYTTRLGRLKTYTDYILAVHTLNHYVWKQFPQPRKCGDIYICVCQFKPDFYMRSNTKCMDITLPIILEGNNKNCFYSMALKQIITIFVFWLNASKKLSKDLRISERQLWIKWH